eukprot:3322497-Rhodomonas_salina.1
MNDATPHPLSQWSRLLILCLSGHDSSSSVSVVTRPAKTLYDTIECHRDKPELNFALGPRGGDTRVPGYLYFFGFLGRTYRKRLEYS